jgi:hypothetical protein
MEELLTDLEIEIYIDSSLTLRPDIWAVYQVWLRVRWPFRALAIASGWARVECLFYFVLHPEMRLVALWVLFLHVVVTAYWAVQELPAELRPAGLAALRRRAAWGCLFLTIILLIGLG